MTSNEFSKWWADLTMRFPNVKAWLSRSFAEESDQRNLLRTWVSVLGDADLSDALEVNRQMQAGDLDFVGDFKEQDIPAHVRRLARRLGLSRRKTTETDLDAERKPSHFPAGKIYKRILELTDKGVSADEAKQIALAEFPIGKPNWEPRYRCSTCCDSGFVTVASSHAIKAQLAGELDACRHREGTMRCFCKSHIASDPRHPIATYDPAQDFLVTDSLVHGPAEIEGFAQWVESKKREYWDGKRDKSFDAFNAREFAQ